MVCWLAAKVESGCQNVISAAHPGPVLVQLRYTGCYTLSFAAERAPYHEKQRDSGSPSQYNSMSINGFTINPWPSPNPLIGLLQDHGSRSGLNLCIYGSSCDVCLSSCSVLAP